MYKCTQRKFAKLVALTITAAAFCPWGTAWADDAPKPDITVEKDGDVVSNPWEYVTGNEEHRIYLKGKDGKDDSDDISLTVNNLPDDTPYNIISGGWNDNTNIEKKFSHKSVKFSVYKGVVKSIYGAYTPKGRVVGNSAEIYDGTVGADADDPFSSAFVAVGGYGTNGAEENKVTIMGTSTINGIVVGGLSEERAADGNTVEMNFGGSNAQALIGGLCYDGNASGNRVTVSYGTINGTNMPDNPFGDDNPFDDIGSVAVAGGMATHRVVNNKVNIRDCKDETGVTGDIYGGYSVNDHAAKNTVQIRNSTITGNIYGGYSKNGNADQNTVQIRNSTITGNIYGGFVGNSENAASNNTVELIGNTIITSDCQGIYGGTGGADDYRSNNNKLVLRLNNRIEVKEIANFQRYDLIVPINYNAVKINEKDTPYVHITGKKTNITSGNIINVGVTNGAKLKSGDNIYLLQNDKGITGATNIQTNLNALGADFTEVKGTLSVEDGTGGTKYLKYTVSGDPKMSEASKSFAETCEAQIIMINSASSLIVNKGIISAKAAAMSSSAEVTATAVAGETVPIVVKTVAFTPFAAFGGSNMQYKTGSHVDSRGWGLNVGFSRIIKYKGSELTLAPLVEYGRSSYDSYLDNGTHGNGKNQYLGIGLAVKNEYKNSLYYDGSLRAGRMKGDYNGLDEYDTASNYIAAHVGIGRVYKLDAKHDIDCYGRFFYSHQNGDTVTFKQRGYVYDFDPVNSYKLRLGARWIQKIGKAQSFYAGLAADYEFDSSATAHYNGLATPSPSLKGLSGMLELGWKQEPTKDNRLGVDMSVNGWQGKQKGVNFNAGIIWAF